ncbi:unnamed protein product [Lathyrus oleraceus]
MAYQNNNYRWSHIHEILEPASYPRHHHQNLIVVTYEKPIAWANQSYHVKLRRETEAGRLDTRFLNRNNSVDLEAEAFIRHEHWKMALAKLMSSMGAT